MLYAAYVAIFFMEQIICFEAYIQHNSTVDQILGSLSKKTGVRKTYLAYGIVGIIISWLAFGWGGELLCNSISFVYPAYYSVKALGSHSKEDHTHWLTYWVVFGSFAVAEYFKDLILVWMPFYWFTKCIFLVRCMSPLDGPSTISYEFIQPRYSRKNIRNSRK